MAWIVGSIVAALAGVFVATRQNCTRCKDGWSSRSVGRGACSWHGGVDE